MTEDCQNNMFCGFLTTPFSTKKHYFLANLWIYSFTYPYKKHFFHEYFILRIKYKFLQLKSIILTASCKKLTNQCLTPCLSCHLLHTQNRVYYRMPYHSTSKYHPRISIQCNLHLNGNYLVHHWPNHWMRLAHHDPSRRNMVHCPNWFPLSKSGLVPLSNQSMGVFIWIPR